MATAQSPSYARAIRATKLPPTEAERVFDQLYHELIEEPRPRGDAAGLSKQWSERASRVRAARVPATSTSRISEPNGVLINSQTPQPPTQQTGPRPKSQKLKQLLENERWQLLDGTSYMPHKQDLSPRPLVSTLDPNHEQQPC